MLYTRETNGSKIVEALAEQGIEIEWHNDARIVIVIGDQQLEIEAVIDSFEYCRLAVTLVGPVKKEG